MTLRVERHMAAVLERLRAAVSPATVDLGVAPSSPSDAGYLVVHPSSGMILRDRLCGSAGRLDLRFDVEAVGLGSEQALWLLDKARLDLLNAQPLEVDGCIVSLFRQTDGSALHRDEIAQPAIYMIDAEFRAVSQPI